MITLNNISTSIYYLQYSRSVLHGLLYYIICKYNIVIFFDIIIVLRLIPIWIAITYMHDNIDTTLATNSNYYNIHNAI